MSTDETTDTTDFDPAKHLTTISGGRYLEVKHRIQWFREQHPSGSIVSEHIELTDQRAIFKATVRDAEGNILATDYGSETPEDFRDHIEKASTKAIGRALSAAGFGTQFVDDHDFGAAQGRVVDSPVGGQYQGQTRRQFGNDPATDRQIKALYAIGRAAKLSDADIIARTQQQFGCAPEQLQRRDASTLIDTLKQEMASPADAGPAGSSVPPTATSSTRRPPAPQVTTPTGDIRPPEPTRITAAPGSQGAKPSLQAFHAFWSAVKRQGWEPQQANDLAQAQFGRTCDQLTPEQLEHVLAVIEDRVGPPPEPPADGLLDLDAVPFDAPKAQ